MSSAETELIARVKCSAELLGMRNLMKDWGVESSGVVYADSSAALAIAKGKGAREVAPYKRQLVMNTGEAR